jgi:hypothetical protein
MTKNSDVERLRSAVIKTSKQLKRQIDDVEVLRKEMRRHRDGDDDAPRRNE